MTTPALTFRPCPADQEPGARLLRAMVDEIAVLYDGLQLDDPRMPKARPADLSPPTGGFLVGWLDGAPVCCGGVKRLSDEACEIKRMYVAPGARRQGVARALLHALEGHARDLGYTIARLDTGPRQPHAQRLYEAEGYAPIANFNANPEATFFGEKRLAP